MNNQARGIEIGGRIYYFPTSSGSSEDINIISGDVITLSGDVTNINNNIEVISGDLESLSATVESIVTSGEVQTLIDEAIEPIETILSGKQDTLIAGDNITIVNNVISAVSGGSGISSAQVQTMIDESISGKADSDDVYTKDEVDVLIEEVEASGITSATCQTMIDRSISGKTDESDFSAHTANTDIHVTAEEKAWWNAQIQALWEAISGTPVPPTPPTPTGYSNQYLTLEVLEDTTVDDTFFAFPTSGDGSVLYYSLDSGSTWSSLTNDTSIIAYLPSLSQGDKVMFKGELRPKPSQGTSYKHVGQFKCYKSFNVEGNIMSIVYGDNFTDKYDLTELGEGVFGSMFSTISSQIKSAENLVLPATTLTKNCYNQMFSYCTSLEKAPVLPATTLVQECYLYMFQHCTSLNEITCLATDISARDCTSSWVTSVTSSGTFKCPSTTNWTSGDSGIPNGWTRVDI